MGNLFACVIIKGQKGAVRGKVQERIKHYLGKLSLCKTSLLLSNRTIEVSEVVMLLRQDDFAAALLFSPSSPRRGGEAAQETLNQCLAPPSDLFCLLQTFYSFFSPIYIQSWIKCPTNTSHSVDINESKMETISPE